MSTYCFNCMNPIEDNTGVCPHCGQTPFGVNPAHQLKTGTLLKDRYLIGKSLGQGGFGITYIGLDTMLEMRVAIKEYYPNGFSNRNHEVTDNVTITTSNSDFYEKGKAGFLREAKTLARFYEEPGIVSVRDFFEANNTAYIVMEYLEGITLKKYVEAKGKISADVLFRVIRPLIQSLEKVHSQGIVHRDISPDNIMILRGGRLKLLDFGSAREVGGDKSLSVMLKPGYAPEEQYRSKGKQGPWTDVYALCATMYFCLTGVRPEESVERAMNPENMLKRPSELDAAITPAQESVILRGMAVHAAERYQSMEELAAALKSPAPPVMEPPVLPEPVDPAPVTVTDQKPNPTPTPKQIKQTSKPIRMFLTLCGLLAMAGLLFGGVKLLSARDINPVVVYLTPTATAAPAVESLSPTPSTTPAPIPTATPTPEPTPKPLTAEELKYIEAENLLASGDKAHAAMAFGALGDYSDARERSFALWDEIAQRDTIAAEDYGDGVFVQGYSAGLKTDGTIVAVGHDYSDWSNVVAIAAGGYNAGHFKIVGLKADGTLYNSYIDWSDIVAIAHGNTTVGLKGITTVGLKTDGTVVALGNEEVSLWTDIIAIAAGDYHIVGLKADGTVVSTSVPATTPTYDGASKPVNFGQGDVSNWSNIVAIAAGSRNTVGLKADGTVLVVGSNEYGQCNVDNWTDVVTVAAGDCNTFAVKSDGTVLAVGLNYDGQCEVSDWTDIIAVAPGDKHTVGLKTDGTVVAVGNNLSGQCDVSDWTDIKIPTTALPLRKNNAPVQ